MKLPKALLGAIVVGLTVQATGCTKKDAPEPKEEQGQKKGDASKMPANCPACGMG
ncbi:chryseobasin-related MNIO class RiPP peptide [Hymenobacter cavernae]|uniref:Lipoprotein n=1 Tax=Hymenobacter cavernae TaxID=2044852 RepID=A0ABQ1U8G5_9BACT|nr:hypothetical protein [Hymenobacter cavernae]GGF13185.1 hypothetical protein GCM10011383_25450 [Hymenobacter cavernae]